MGDSGVENCELLLEGSSFESIYSSVDHAFARTTHVSESPSKAAEAAFKTPMDFNSSTAVTTTACGRHVARARLSTDEGEDGGKAISVRMCASTHAAGIETRSGCADAGEGLISAQPNDGMQTRGEPANIRGKIADWCGNAALMVQSGRMMRHVPEAGKRSGCSAESK